MKKKVCVLGSGLVSKPIIRHLASNKNIELTVASLYLKDIDFSVGNLSNVIKTVVNAANPSELEKLLKDKDIVISLLPANMHPPVARTALKTRTHFVCTSYLSDRIKEIDAEAKAKGVILINECGMDPGLDHMSSMSIINSLKSNNYKIVSYESYGSGIPAPDSNDNPWGYKFSWSPRGVIMAGQSEATFLRHGDKIHLLPGTIFSHTWNIDVPGLYEMEAYPNRNSMKYIELYGLNGVQTMVRATLRNKGWGKIWTALYQLGILNEIFFIKAPRSNRKLFDTLTDFKFSKMSKEKVTEFISSAFSPEAAEAINWLGLLDESELVSEAGNSIDMLAALMEKKMAYKKGERDMVLLFHVIKAINEKGEEKTFYSQLTAMGDPDGETAMAKTVSLPSAIATELIINKKISSPGVHIPVEPEIYEPVLKGLKSINIEVKESEPDLL